MRDSYDYTLLVILEEQDISTTLSDVYEVACDDIVSKILGTFEDNYDSIVNTVNKYSNHTDVELDLESPTVNAASNMITLVLTSDEELDDTDIDDLTNIFSKYFRGITGEYTERFEDEDITVTATVDDIMLSDLEELIETTQCSGIGSYKRGSIDIIPDIEDTEELDLDIYRYTKGSE